MAERRSEKKQLQKEAAKPQTVSYSINQKRKDHYQLNAFVLGNGLSREPIDPNDMSKIGPVYGCNALYRTFSPDYLVAVDVKMILEINKAGYQHNNEVWTNPNKAYGAMQNLNFFKPSKGWSSGPTALWLAAQHGHRNIFILGFDYKGLENGTKFNNIYADTKNYKQSRDGATFFGNWLRQTKSVIENHKDINFYRVIAPDNYRPDELNKLNNLTTIDIKNFQNMFGI